MRGAEEAATGSRAGLGAARDDGPRVTRPMPPPLVLLPLMLPLSLMLAMLCRRKGAV